MTAGQMKGALLEYIVRKLLLNCGFTSVVADGHYIFQQAGTGLYFINGKGAAHDGDVLMEPPIQMPFSYPSRLLFECKSYEKTIGLDVVRNALGLRYDINEFEIVTDATLAERQNNRRANYAIANRKRYHYQVGIASVEEFSKPAFEFAANNKISLLSLRWFLPEAICDLFHHINSDYLNSMSNENAQHLYSFLKNKNIPSTLANTDGVVDLLENDEVIGSILRAFATMIDHCVIGLLETGDLLFLFANETAVTGFFSQRSQGQNLQARLHYHNDPTKWTLAIADYESGLSDHPYELEFNVPASILRQWRQFNFDKTVGYNLKGEFFSRIFIFSHRAAHYGLPFSIVNLDSEWLDDLRTNE